ncbi:fatty-acid-AMP ligase FadD25 [Mycobacterium tuberculosis KT-0032]|nr:fatty-acid-AMP ligase FadD25 [Mycobacterium tuberculosis KT-0032]KBM67884.1 fatty-acid-AMP ligase FadD25 [Mycobacterium tuberculosis KT-0033]
MSVVESSLPGVLRERASFQPNDKALTFIDYERSWDGVEETLTWSQLYRRTLNLAAQLREHGSTGDRALILAPQSLDYVVSFIASLQAGIVAVPLSIPQGGAHDERTVSVFADTAPAIVLTASSVVDNVVEYVQPQPGQNAPAVIEVDRLDLDARPSSGSRSAAHGHPDILYLQYTSGSTRTPAGVMVSNKNLFANFEQIMTSYYGVYGKVAPPGSTVVSWLPFYHDMGFVLGLILPILAGIPAVLTSPIGFLQRPARWIQMLASNTLAFTAAPNFAFDLASRKTKDEDMEGLDLGGVHGILNGSERVQPVTLKRFIDRFAPFNLDPKAIRPSYGMAEATVYVATRKAGQPNRQR